MKTLFFVLLSLLILLAGAIKTHCQTKEIDTTLPIKVEFYRQGALLVLREHIKKHPKCELKNSIPYLENALINFGDLEEGIGGAVFHAEEIRYSRIIFDMFVVWDTSTWKKRLIHEALHLTPTGSKAHPYICTDDKRNRPNKEMMPACRLFGKIQKDTDDINRDLDEHLEDTFKELEGRGI
jgi:hypothetical protein